MSRDIPIIFSATMIRALIEGRKTQTRRLADRVYIDKRGYAPVQRCEPSQWQKVKPGDRLWVRNSFDCFPVYFRKISFGDGKYAAGTDGKIYNMRGAPSVCASHTTAKGYEEITLRHNGEQRPFRVHRLVAEAFYGAPPHSDAVTLHMDSNPGNNVPQNLDWGTPEQNSADANALGRWNGERNRACTLSESQVQEIISSSEPQADLAVRFGVTQPTISKIKSGSRRAGVVGAAPPRNLKAWKPWGPSIHCPRWASRITLIVTATKIEPLQAISEADAMAEGFRPVMKYTEGMPPDEAAEVHRNAARDWYSDLWKSLHGVESWRSNPEVIAITFRVVLANIDAPEARAA